MVMKVFGTAVGKKSTGVGMFFGRPAIIGSLLVYSSYRATGSQYEPDWLIITSR